GLHQGEVVRETIHPGIVVGVEPNEHVRVNLPRQPAQYEVQQTGTQFCCSTRGLDHGRELDGLRQGGFPPLTPPPFSAQRFMAGRASKPRSAAPGFAQWFDDYTLHEVAAKSAPA